MFSFSGSVLTETSKRDCELINRHKEKQYHASFCIEMVYFIPCRVCYVNIEAVNGLESDKARSAGHYSKGESPFELL